MAWRQTIFENKTKNLRFTGLRTEPSESPLHKKSSPPLQTQGPGQVTSMLLYTVTLCPSCDKVTEAEHCLVSMFHLLPKKYTFSQNLLFWRSLLTHYYVYIPINIHIHIGIYINTHTHNAMRCPMLSYIWNKYAPDVTKYAGYITPLLNIRTQVSLFLQATKALRRR
jgi:hypothetical protein